jgi:hypothetical protein
MQRPFNSSGRDGKPKNFPVAARHNGITEAHPAVPGADLPGTHPDFAEKGSIARRPDAVRDDSVLETRITDASQHGGDRISKDARLPSSTDYSRKK